MSKLVQKVGGVLSYVSPAEYNAEIGLLPVYTGTTQDDFVDAFNTQFTEVDFGIIGEFSVTHTKDNEEKIYSMNCADNLFLDTGDKKVSFSGVLLENVKIDTLSTLTASDRQTVSGTIDRQFMGYQTKTATFPVTAYKFVSCPFKVTDSTDLKPWKRVYMYITSASLTGDLVQQFFKQGDTFEGVGFEVVSDGGVFISEMKEAATEAELI